MKRHIITGRSNPALARRINSSGDSRPISHCRSRSRRRQVGPTLGRSPRSAGGVCSQDSSQRQRGRSRPTDRLGAGSHPADRRRYDQYGWYPRRCHKNGARKRVPTENLCSGRSWSVCGQCFKKIGGLSHPKNFRFRQPLQPFAE